MARDSGDTKKWEVRVPLGREEVRLAERNLDRFVTYVHDQIRFQFEAAQVPGEPTIFWVAKIMNPDGTYRFTDWSPRTEPVPDYLDSVVAYGQHFEVIP